jgi:hypothetical protein
MLELVALRGRPDLPGRAFSGAIQGTWPEFMRHHPAAGLCFEDPHLDACLDTAFAVVDPARPGEAVGRAFVVAFALEGVAGRDGLPDSGWDGVVRWAHEDRALGRRPDAPSALPRARAASPRPPPRRGPGRIL